ncbi:MAG: lysophospholipid acyltransferase family protein [Nocardioidaceae bacterium]
MTRALRFIRFLVRPLLMVFTKRDWRGTEHFPDEGFVLAANHVSHLDPFTFAHFCVDNGIPPRYLAKASVMELPVIGRLVRSSQQIPVYRGSATAAGAFSAAVDAVRKGACIIIYPEGTITRDPDLWPMGGKTGAARVALTTGCPVVPAAQWGPQEILAPYAKRVRLLPRKTMHVLVGPPVELDDLRGRPITAQLLTEATDRIMDAIAAQMSELRGEPVPAERISLKDARARERPTARKKPKKTEET